MKRLVLAMIAMLAFAVNADAQGFLGRLKDRAVSTAKSAIESNVQHKVYTETNKAVDDTFDGKVIKKKGKKSKDDEAVSEEVEEAETENEPQTATSSDFKRGSVVLFQDDVTAETVGEFPSKWDLLDGNAEVKSHGNMISTIGRVVKTTLD